MTRSKIILISTLLVITGVFLRFIFDKFHFSSAEVFAFEIEKCMAISNDSAKISFYDSYFKIRFNADAAEDDGSCVLPDVSPSESPPGSSPEPEFGFEPES